MRYMNRISEIIYSKIPVKGRNVLYFFDLHQLKTSKNTTNVQNVEKNAIHVTMINLLMCKMSCWLKNFLSWKTFQHHKCWEQNWLLSQQTWKYCKGALLLLVSILHGGTFTSLKAVSRRSKVSQLYELPQYHNRLCLKVK